ncbi:hypothetical protein E4U19_007227 [Claviceps sp. Clav32 group G5]|nr:hypothetical protein E4U19_007227 [Claviceps sp. Clav32 group G5]
MNLLSGHDEEKPEGDGKGEGRGPEVRTQYREQRLEGQKLGHDVRQFLVSPGSFDANSRRKRDGTKIGDGWYEISKVKHS